MTHTSPGRLRLSVIGAALLITAAIPQTAGAAAPHPSRASAATASASAGTGSTATVTLLTGDRVTVTRRGSGPAAISVVGPDGGEADASITTRGGDTYVHPRSAARYLASGKLDERLFNVTRLIADGYDDAHMDQLPLIVTYDRAATAARGAERLAATLPDEASGVRPLSSVGGAALAEDRDGAGDFWAALTGGAEAPTARTAPSAPFFAGSVDKVWLDGKAEAQLADTTAQIGAPDIWAGGNTGKGVDVAVLDSGYDVEHPDLRDTVATSSSFVPGESVDDGHGHGTHVASTVAGSGAASDGREKGVAPGASLHVGKVLSDGGSGLDSWIIAGMEWAARDVGAKVVSMSLGSDEPSDGTDLLSRAVDELSAETGALFTIAAGNSGPGDHTVRSPGTASAALTVGAVDTSDALADFSSRGPRFGDDGLKPEITAPGVDVLAARSRLAWEGEGSYTTMSGTSMATPHVAGAAALLAAAHPHWTGQQLKNALVSTAEPTPALSVDDGGNGRVDAVAATTATLSATAAVDAGIHSLGGAPGETVVKTVEWTNTAADAVTVDLAVDAPGAPADLFTLSTGRLTVPARGTASATVTTHLDAAPAAHRFTGRVTGSVSGAVATRTLLGVSTREKPYHLRAELREKDGSPLTADVLVEYLREGGGESGYGYAYADNGVMDVIVQPGTYALWGFAPVKGVHGASSRGLALLNAPSVEVHADTTAILGGPGLHESRAVTPRPSTADNQGRIDYLRSFDTGEAVATSLTVGTGFDSTWLQQAPKVTDGETVTTLRWRKKQPPLALTSGDQVFDDLWTQPGSTLLPATDTTMRAVFAGAGLPADYAGLDTAGKAVVVRRGDDDEQIDAAEAAGVTLLLIVNDENGRLYEPLGRTPLAVAGLSATGGEKLISRITSAGPSGVPMHVVSHPDTDYLYDLVKTWRDHIPADPTYAPKEKQLATLDVEFRNNPAHTVDEYRFDLQPYASMRQGVTVPSTAGAARTDYVTTDPAFRWYEEAYEYAPETGPESLQYSEQLRYPAGRTTDVTWFGPFQRPRVNTGIDLPRREGNEIAAYVPGWGDSGENHAGVAGYGPNSQTTELYRDGRREPVATTDGGYLFADVPAAPAVYRLVTTTSRTGSYPFSTSTRTEWTFRSTAARDAAVVRQLPLVQLDYDLPTDAHGSAARNASLLVTPSHLPGGPRTALRTTDVALSYDDGAHWQRATISSSSQGARVKLRAPAGSRFLTVRVTATDGRGNTITQTIVRAAGLR
ncbi:S8 family serine peptidase [uncultured Streptomyces sp.]|uniref:S8 family serine peptidase n=1 Tax=uncultured Streptomyces sp. TaxID=174707 RepID=UPI00262B7BF2|nr:S8 family serine peptidase [uncultured Streptomyces sp.]